VALAVVVAVAVLAPPPPADTGKPKSKLEARPYDVKLEEVKGVG
jgi:hypothetical protein